ncbi:MAG TPA: HAMP domain-containing sensor histidine kinase, partial [bacterium]|nr:HAMP domain-containing sensor histidine kinase [bacterium]
FIAITNHELRTPVSVLSNIVEILSQELHGHQMEPMVRMIERSSRQLAEIVGQMHEISRAKGHRLELLPTLFNLREACQEVLDEFALVLERRHHTVSVDMPADLQLVADRVKLKKVVRELAQNAIKFTEDGGQITVYGRALPDQRVLLAVKDTGIGIALEHQDKIFTLFYEVGDSLHHHTSKDEFLGGGMGVGLSIVSDIVAAHRGELKLTSEPGKGSTFTVILPPAIPASAVVSNVA